MSRGRDLSHVRLISQLVQLVLKEIKVQRVTLVRRVFKVLEEKRVPWHIPEIEDTQDQQVTLDIPDGLELPVHRELTPDLLAGQARPDIPDGLVLLA